MSYSSNVSFINIFTQRVDSSKKIRVNNVADTVTAIFEYVDYFNTITEFQDRIMDVPFSDIEVIDELTDFITPRTVRYNSNDKRTVDLLSRNALTKRSVDTFRPDEWVDLQAKFRGYFKKDLKSDTKRLSDLKVDVNFNDVLPRMSCIIVNHSGADDEWVEELAQYNGVPFVPIPLVGVSALFRSSYFNADKNEILTDYVNELRF